MEVNVSRRCFLAGAGAFGVWGAFGGCRFLPGVAGGRPKLKFGVVSDVHVRLAPDGAGLVEANDTRTFIHTLEWFRDQGVDAVMITGDIADFGLVREMEAVAAAWFKVFPNDKAPDGRTVTRLFVCGNHDWEGFNYGKYVKTVFPDPVVRAKEVFRTDCKGNWERIWHEAYAPVWMKSVNGYSFIGAHWSADKCRGGNEVGVVGVPEFFSAHGKELDPSRPFFYFQHPHPKDTCYGSWAWGHDSGTSTKVLSAYPNAVAFSGHSHYSLLDERSIWQGAFTSIGAGSLRYAGLPFNEFDSKGGYENVGGYYKDRKGSVGKIMETIWTKDARTGMLLAVYDDHMTITRRDFVSDCALGPDWVMPLPAAESKPFAFAEHAKRYPAPQFPAGAELKVERALHKGKSKKGIDVFNLTVPAAVQTFANRVWRYEVGVETKDGGKVVLTRRVLSPDYHLPLEKAKKSFVLPMPVVDLPQDGDFRFTVTPFNCFGRAGRPLATGDMKVART